jgi:hypothetical protein
MSASTASGLRNPKLAAPPAAATKNPLRDIIGRESFVVEPTSFIDGGLPQMWRRHKYRRSDPKICHATAKVASHYRAYVLRRWVREVIQQGCCLHYLS